jgi:DNA-binding IclR family transcriptional regulator
VDDPLHAQDWRVIGELPKSLEDTLNVVEAGDTNEALAGRLGINLTTCNNRTDRLVKLRLLRRTLHQGELGYKQYEFAPVLASF